MRKAGYRNEIIILLALFAIYMFVLFRVTVFRDSGLWGHGVNLVPLSTIAEYLKESIRGHMVVGVVNLFGNLVLFLPLGYLAASLFPKVRKLSRVLILSLCLSVAIETLQYALVRGAADIDDVILNTIGAVMGYGFFVLRKRCFGAGKRLGRRVGRFAVPAIALVVAFAISGLVSMNSVRSLHGPGSAEASNEIDVYLEPLEVMAPGDYAEESAASDAVGHEGDSMALSRRTGADRSPGMTVAAIGVAPGDLGGANDAGDMSAGEAIGARTRSGAIGYRQSGGDEVAWNLILVNRWNYIPEGYEADLIQLANGQHVDRRIYPALQEMLDAARMDGVYPVVSSGYRTAEQQQRLLDEKVSAYRSEGYSAESAKTKAKAWVAAPGTSEHQLGIAVDINADKDRSASYEVYDWLSGNARKFGFIYRYPSGKSEITGVFDEPWHYRYVGADAAADIYYQGLCLEEYLHFSGQASES